MSSLWDMFSGAPPEGFRDDRGLPFNNGYGTASPDFWRTLGNVDWSKVSGSVGAFQDGQRQQTGGSAQGQAPQAPLHRSEKRPYRWLKVKGLLDG